MVDPPKRSLTGVTGTSKLFPLPKRADSFAFTKTKKQRKLKKAEVSSYRLANNDKKQELEKWLLGRFHVDKAELKLELVGKVIQTFLQCAKLSRSVIGIYSIFLTRTI